MLIVGNVAMLRERCAEATHGLLTREEDPQRQKICRVSSNRLPDLEPETLNPKP
jgi:hypothetical protein